MSEHDTQDQEVVEELTDEQIDELLNEEPETSDVDDTEAVIQKKDAIIRQVLARAKRAEAKLTENKPPAQNKKPEKKDDDIRQTVEQLALAEQKRQFGYENNLSPDETDYIFKVNPNPTSELLNDPFIKGGLDAVRSKKRDVQNTPSLNSRSPRFELPKKKDMNSDDKQIAFEEFMKTKFNK
jgi:hypothetical protein